MEKILIFESKEEAKQTIPINQVRRLKINGEFYCIAQLSDGFVVFENDCPHSGHNLSDGKINLHGEIVCPSHTYRFDLNTGQCDRKCRDLKIYPTKWQGERLFVWI